MDTNAFNVSFDSVRETTAVEQLEEVSTVCRTHDPPSPEVSTAAPPRAASPHAVSPPKSPPKGALKRSKVAPIPTIDASVSSEQRKLKEPQDILLELFHTEVSSVATPTDTPLTKRRAVRLPRISPHALPPWLTSTLAYAGAPPRAHSSLQGRVCNGRV